jgi:hypothetical protein
MHAGTTSGAAYAFRPARDMGDDQPQTPFDGGADARVVSFQPKSEILDVAKRFLGLDNLHAPRSLASVASTWLSEAKRPSLAARRPRSIPLSSSGVGS